MPKLSLFDLTENDGMMLERLLMGQINACDDYENDHESDHDFV